MNNNQTDNKPENLDDANTSPALSVSTPYGRLYVKPGTNLQPKDYRTKQQCRKLINDGVLMPSVTNIISMKSSPHLIAWASRLIAEEAVKVEQKWPGKLTADPSKAVKYLKETANRERDHWAQQGTNIHNAVEKLAAGETIDISSYTDYEQASIAEWVQWNKKVEPKFFGIETTCYGETSDGYKYAGTADFIAEINNRMFAGDYKCVTEDTQILLSNGATVQASLLLEGDEVVAWDEKQNLHSSRVSYVGDNGVKPIIKITTDLGLELECTENHPILVSQNNKKSTWVNAENLNVGDVAYTTLGWSLNPNSKYEEWPLPNGLSPYVVGVLWALKNMRGSLDESSVIRLPKVTRPEAREELKDLGFKKAKGNMISAGNALRKIARKANWTPQQVSDSITEEIPEFVYSAQLAKKEAFLAGVSEIFYNPERIQNTVYIVLKNVKSLHSLATFTRTMGIISKYGVDKNSGLHYVRVPKTNSSTILGYGTHPTKIVKIERLEPKRTVAIEVEGAHTHVTSGIITHNTNRSGLHPEIALQLAAITNATHATLDNETLIEMPKMTGGGLGVHLSPKGATVRKINTSSEVFKVFEALTRVWHFNISANELSDITEDSLFGSTLEDKEEY
jgi:hypothetical protein